MELIQPKKLKQAVKEPRVAFEEAIAIISGDMRLMQEGRARPCARLLPGDARDCAQVPTESVDLFVTSPPYANNFDYADAVRLEMSFWGEVSSWADLHSQVRRHLLVSCSQHAAAERLDLNILLSRSEVAPIADELAAVTQELARVRHLRGGKKHYHTMVAAYFVDMALTLRAIRRVAREGAEGCFVIGDSAPYAVYVPVHDWLGRLAVAAGFSHTCFEKTRDRNLKWKNRKHRVPLVEGRLWISDRRRAVRG